MSKPPAFDNWPERLPVAWGPYRAVCVHDPKYDDGDTLRFWVSLGFDEYAYISGRLRDVRTPEKSDPDPDKRLMAIECRDKLWELVPNGARCRLRTERAEGLAEQASFSRWVVVVELVTPTGGFRIANEQMNAWLESVGYVGGS